MIWKITYINKQMQQNEANSGIHLQSLCSYIQSVKHSSLLGCDAVSLGGQLAAFWSIMVLSEHQELLALWYTITSQKTWVLHIKALFAVRSCVPHLQSIMMKRGFVNSVIHPNTQGSTDGAETCTITQKAEYADRQSVCMFWQPFGTHTVTVNADCTAQQRSTWRKPLQSNVLACSRSKWFFFLIAHVTSELLGAVLMEMSCPSTM
jgi:hypothetical protein